MSDAPVWQVERRGAVVIATHHNPPMNYLTAAGARQLRELVGEWRDPDIRAVVLTGGIEGRFITHYSVEEFIELTADREAVIASGTAHTERMHAARQELNELPKPVIAAMNGDTMGGGFETALACDIRIGQRGDYRYGLPEVRLGLLPGGSGTQRLSRLIGAGRAIEFILRGRIVRPEEALDLGLIHEVADDARARAVELAEELSRLSPTSMAMVKRAVYQGSDVPFASGLRIESEALFHVRLSPEVMDTMRAYVALPFDERRDWLEG
jgi:enoyl-CoA hydratase